jgi:hypothetical protein
MILGEVASRCLYLVTEPIHVGLGWVSLLPALAYGLELPTDGTRPTCPVPSCLVVVAGGGAFQGKGSFPGVDI